MKELSRKDFKILIANENMSQCKALSLIISHKGYSVVTVSNGPDVLKAADNEKLDMILMDIEMPLLDGIKTARCIKAGNSDIAIVLMTGYAFEELIKESIEMSPYSLIYKPFNFAKILRIIEEHRESEKASLVLLVDKDEEIFPMQERILMERGFETGRTFSADGAVELLRSRPLDIIFLDVVLPLLSCLEIFSELKRIKPDIVTVVTTAFREETSDIIRQSLSKSLSACIHKPFEIEEIIRLIEEVRKVKELRQ
jgi:two-component system response regulator HydG